MEKEEEYRLVEKYLSNGDEAAATKFVRTYQNFVYATALRYLKNDEDTNDAAQEVFIKAFKSFEKFNFKSSLKTWLYRITVNHCINILRKRKLKKFISFSNFDDNNDPDVYRSNSYNPEEELENKEFEVLFRQSLHELPEKQRETFALRYFDEMPYDEISAMLGTSVGGLKANYYQAVKKLAKIMKNSDKQGIENEGINQ